MRTVTESCSAETVVKRSRFLSYLVPIAEFETLHRRLQKEHPKANHIVYAYRRFNEHRQIVENSSDDGEPKGCAGAPSLNLLRGNDLVECGIVTVRYFGGIKLGTGGMARAYGDAAKSVIKKADLQIWKATESRELRCSYAQLRVVEYRAESLGIAIVQKNFGSGEVVLKLLGTSKSLDRLLGEHRGVERP